ncbi:hypothetical protein [Aurantibacter sp.]|uniref:hypothetical protein n=1 Tax=Aurantibacter sp. TaxID=2807103 RepID=UPI0035C7B10E
MILFIVSFSFAQTPEGFNYQSVIRDTAGDIIVNTTIGVQFQLRQTTTMGSIIYTETHSPTTNNYGMFNVIVGQGTTSDTFNTIDWSSDSYFLEVSIDPIGGTTYVSLGTTQLLSVPYALNAATADNVTGLETIDEGNGNGLIKIGRIADNYGNIGNNAVDLSYSDSASASKGATGLYSTATGWNTSALGNASTTIGVSNIASGHIATAMGNETSASGNGAVTMGDGTVAESFTQVSIGTFNVPTTPTSAIAFEETDRVLVVGNGTALASESDALVVLKNGTITAPSFDLAEITDDKALITKEYFETSISGLVYLDETDDTTDNGGLIIAGRTAEYYGDIGKNAIDLSFSDGASTTYGATGEHAVALGRFIEASGNYSTAMGHSTEASGIFATAMGFSTDATGYYSTAMGQNTIASGSYSTAMGHNTIASGPYSTVMGRNTNASGNYATAMGQNTNANSWGSTAIGHYNIGGGSANSWIGTESLFEIGNGTDAANKANALTVLKNGIITAPSFDLAEITDDKALITKEYFETNNTTPTGLEAIDQGNGTGWRLSRNILGFGNIGRYAVDLSYNIPMSGSFGATGFGSFAVGERTNASGDTSAAFGSNTNASGIHSAAFGIGTTASGGTSVAFGFLTTATGYLSTAMGERTNANSQSSLSIGQYNIGGGTPDSWIATESVFEIGNGVDDSNRANALTVLKNGTITAPSFDVAEITDDKALITKEYADANYSSETIETENGVSYATNWSDFGSGYEGVTYYKHNGRVYIDGMAIKSSIIIQDEVIFTLPAGYQPTGRITATGQRLNESIRIDINSSGQVIIRQSGNTYVSLNGINFRVD